MRANVVLCCFLVAVVAGALRSRPVAASPPDSSTQVTVDGLQCGAVTGFYAEYPNPYYNKTATVANFWGIPFAQPPLQQLRLAAPLPATCDAWTNGNLNATAFSGFCIQPDGTGTEDCLYLNIYVPQTILKRSNQSQLYPVSFYIHGGGLTGGSGIWEPHGSFSAFAGGEGVVAVTINYRLGMLGFIAHESLLDPTTNIVGNYGILDQLMALQWVQQNIAAFGGDPSKVTLAGQSSGGTSIFALMASPMSKGLFRGAVSFSGSPNITMDRPSKFAQDAEIPGLLNCSKATSAATAACIRALPASVVGAAMPNSWNTPGLFHLNNLSPNGWHFAGLVYVDGVVLTMSFPDAMKAGLNGDVAIVIANMGQEDNLVGGVGKVPTLNVTEWHQFLVDPVFSAWKSDSYRLGTDVFNEYKTEAEWNPLLAYDSINADYGLTCANNKIAIDAKRAGLYQAPIYISVNQWPPQWPNNNRTQSFAYHMWDYESAIMNTGNPHIAPIDVELGNLVRSTWYSIIAYGKMTSTAAGSHPWLAVDEVNGFPGFYNTFVYSRPDRFPFYDSSRTRINYKQSTCGMWASYGFDERYWWCD